MIVKTTYGGDIECPDTADAVSRWWAMVIADRMRTEELYGLMQAIREEAFNEGIEYIVSVLREAQGSITPEPANAEEGGAWSAGSCESARVVPGCCKEGSECECRDEEEVAEGLGDLT